MKRLSLWIIALILLLPAYGRAMTRDAAIAYALKNSESAKISKASAAILRAGGDQVVAFTRPQALFEAAYLEMRTNADEITLGPPFSDLSAYLNPPERDISAQVSLSQTLYAGGRIWNSLNLRDTYYEQADTMEASDLRDIRKQVKTAFDTVLYQRAVLNILKDRVEQRQHELADADDLKSVGVVTSLDVRQAKLSLNFALDALKSGKAVYQEDLINFNTVIGAAKGDRHVPEGMLEELPDLLHLFGQLDDMLKKQSFLDVAALKQQVKSAELNYEIAHGGYLPQVMLVSSGKSNGEKIDDTVESWNVGVQMSWPIFDGGLTRAKKASARAELRKSKENLGKVQKALAGSVAAIKINGKSLMERALLQREAIELSRQNYNDARGHYRAGTITLTRLGEFNLSYAEARFNLLRLYFLQRELVSSSEALLNQ